ncbi:MULTISPECIES: hypothetical protein [unclassified Streptomyces]|uniref:hypothetical protein n=1 Tax=unclassified Streptomyces TaxID=2593676 RepID=UPI002365FD08|nr:MULTISPECIES: hypothetical protein [unclassified Streptomyces]MDF3148542.1 hypothetical protein [Streptomyces sp. T21Q-yed]WDF39321.1 hypothetical protein PBV52_22195 [Streptomyces sp. T12]
MTTTLTATTTPATGTPRGPRGLVWAVLRVHRTALVFWGLTLTAATAGLIWMHTIADDARRGNVPCAEPAHDGLPSCASVEAITVDGLYSDGIALVTTALCYVILPVAAWAGGALIGRELESGTARLAWTQSVTPARWLAAKLAVPAALLTAGTGAVLLLNLWARTDDNPNLVGDWYGPDQFSGIGPVAVAYALAGLALGTLAGLLLRRTLPAAGVGFAAALLLHTVLERYREDLWPTVTRSEKGEFELPRSAWQQDGDITWGRHPGEGTPLSTSATFHPQSHFWPLQYVETGIVLVVAAAATLAAFRLLRRRMP